MYDHRPLRKRSDAPLRRGVCRLCELEKDDLRDSHFMPSALYPKRGEYEFVSLSSKGRTDEHISQRLLCGPCEERFNKNGESAVLRAIAPKSAKWFPLHEKMRVALPRDFDPSGPRFAGYEFGLDMDKFAYFALSIIWRGAVTVWKKPDGDETTALDLDGWEEPIRKFLLGEAPFPPDTAVIVLVGSDATSRKAWFVPTQFVELNCMNFRFLTRGVFFRIAMGRHLPQMFRDYCCTSARKCIFYGDLERRTREAFGEPQ